jgi:hypothetical protein
MPQYLKGQEGRWDRIGHPVRFGGEREAVLRTIAAAVVGGVEKLENGVACARSMTKARSRGSAAQQVELNLAHRR